MARPDDEIDRFFEKVEYGEDFNGSRCLVWKGSMGGNGHVPSFGMNDAGKKRIPVPQYAYALDHGDRFLEVGKGYEFTHKCGNDLCVNSLHIMAVDFSVIWRPSKADKEAANA